MGPATEQNDLSLGRQTMRFCVTICAASAFLFQSGCSVYMAATFPTPVNLQVAEVGTPHILVVHEYGAPISTENGLEVYEFYDGIPLWANLLRSLGWSAADFFTIFLWEAVGTPLEAGSKSLCKSTAEVVYNDKREVVKASVVDWDGELLWSTKGNNDGHPRPLPPGPRPPGGFDGL